MGFDEAKSSDQWGHTQCQIIVGISWSTQQCTGKPYSGVWYSTRVVMFGPQNDLQACGLWRGNPCPFGREANFYFAL